MGQYQAVDKFGVARLFKIKGDSPSPTEQARIDTVLQGGQFVRTPKAPEDEPGILDALSGGFSRGVRDVGVQARTMQEALSANRPEEPGILRNLSENIAPETPAYYRSLADENRKYRDAVDVPEGELLGDTSYYDKARILASGLGQSLPATLASAGTIAGGALLGGAAAGPPGAVVGGALGTAASFGVYYPGMFSENVERQIEVQGDVKDWGAAARSAAVKAGLESITDRVTMGVAGVLKRTLTAAEKAALKRGTDSAIKTAAKRVGNTAAVSAVTGGIEEFAQEASTRFQAGQNLQGEEANAAYLESAVQGAILEGLFGTALGGAGAVGDFKKVRAEQSARRAAQDERDRFAQDAELNSQANLARRTAQPAPPPVAGYLENERLASDAPDTIAVGEEKIHSPSRDFSEDEYRRAIELLRDEKSVSVDKVRRKMGGLTPQKASAIFAAMRERGDATTTGTDNQYLRVKPRREYVVSPIPDEDAKPYRVVIGGDRQVGSDSFKTAEEATDWAQRAGVKKFEVVQSKADQQHGLYEYFKDGDKVTGKRLVKSFATAQEANKAAQEYDPSFGPQSNEKAVQYTAELKRQRNIEEIRKELGAVSTSIQDRLDKIVGKGRVTVDIVPMVDREYLLKAGVPEDKIPNSYIEGVTLQRKRMDIREPLRQVIAVSADLYDASLTPEQREAKLNDVINHELVHALRNLNILTEAEWNELIRHALSERVPGENFTHMQRALARAEGTNTPGNRLAEEGIAEMVRLYQRDPAAYRGRPRSILKKIGDFLRRLLGLGRRYKAEDIMDAMFGGEMAARNEGHGGLDRTYPGDPMFSSVKVPGFYMKSDKFFMNDKLQDKAPLDQWLGLIRNSGIKKAELDWLGLEDHLRDLAAKKKEKGQPTTIERGEILDHIRKNGIDLLEEKRSNEPGKLTPDEEIELANLDDTLAEGHKKARKLYAEWAYNAGHPIGYDDTHFESWINTGDEPEVVKYRNDRARYLELYNKKNPPTPRYEFIRQRGGTNYTEHLFHLPGLKPQYIAPHFDGYPDLLFATRTTDRVFDDGLKTLFIEEAQSDLHQQGKKSGYVTPENAAELDRLREEEEALSEKHAEMYNDRVYLKETIRHYMEQAEVNPDLSDMYEGLAAKKQQEWAEGTAAWIALDNQVDALRERIAQLEEASVPDAPFKTTWDEVAFKRLLRYAIENGYDQIAWHGSPESVAATERWGPLLKKKVTNKDGKEEVRYYKQFPDDLNREPQDVTGVINLYLKRMPNYASFKNFNKYNTAVVFQPAPVSRKVSKFFPDGLDDIQSFMANMDMPEETYTKLRRLAQVLANARAPDLPMADRIDAAAERVGLTFDDLEEIENQLFVEDPTIEEMGSPVSVDTDANGNPVYDRNVVRLSEELKKSIMEEGQPWFSQVGKEDYGDPVLNDIARFSEVARYSKFQQWFKDSNVRDPNTGEPLVVYHYTRAPDYKSFNKLSHFGTLGAAQDRMRDKDPDLYAQAQHWDDTYIYKHGPYVIEQIMSGTEMINDAKYRWNNKRGFFKQLPAMFEWQNMGKDEREKLFEEYIKRNNNTGKARQKVNKLRHFLEKSFDRIDPKFIQDFMMQSQGTRIIPAYLNIRNPLVIPDLGNHSPNRYKAFFETLQPDLTKRQSGYDPHLLDADEIRKDPWTPDDVIAVMDRIGYDGFAYSNIVEDYGSVSWIVLRPEQIKSPFNTDFRADDVDFSQVWHGSPHDFEEFSTNYMGTGEGAQAFGWGMYFAGSKGLAKHYRDTLSEKGLEVTVHGDMIHPSKFDLFFGRDEWNKLVRSNFGKAPGYVGPTKKYKARWVSELNDLLEYQWPEHDVLPADGKDFHIFTGGYPAETALGQILNHDMTLDQAIENMRNIQYPHYPVGALDDAERFLRKLDPKITGKGRLYNVDIPDNDELLLYDQPWEDQPNTVKQRLKAHASKAKKGGGMTIDDFGIAVERFENENRQGSQFYYHLSNAIGGDYQASMALRNAGIPGHRFLNSNERWKGKSDRIEDYNFVIYDDSRVAVVAKFSQVAGLKAPPAAPPDRLTEVTQRLTYNNLVPLIQKLGKVFGTKFGDAYAEKVEDTFITLQDRMLPIGKLIDRMKKNGGFISNENDTYLRDTLFSGRVDARITEHEKLFYKPLFDAIKYLKVNKDHAKDVAKLTPASQSIIEAYSDPRKALAELYIYALHAKERNAKMRERNAKLAADRPDQWAHGSGIRDDEADYILKWFTQQPFHKDFQNVAAKFKALINSTNDVRVEGRLNPDFRKMFRKDGTKIDDYDNYAPLRSWIEEHMDPDDDALTFAKAGRGFSIRGKEDFSATGRRSLAAHIVEHAVLQNEEAIIRAEKNRVGLSFYKLIKDNPDAMKDIAEIVEKPMKAVYDSKTGRVKMAFDHTYLNDPSVLKVKNVDKQIYIKMKDVRIAKALGSRSSLGNAGLGPLMKGLLTVNRFLAAARTSYNPEFLVANMLRDLEAALVNVSEINLPGVRKDIIASVVPALRGVWHSQRTGEFNTEWGKLFDEFSKRGGKTAFYGIRQLEDTLNKTNKALQLEPSKFAKATHPIMWVGKVVEDMNAAIENGTRLATYRVLRDKFYALGDRNDPKFRLKAEEHAARISKNLTVNFNAGGEVKPLMNALYLFYNASLQGSMALINPMIRSKKVRAMWAGVVVAGVLQDLLWSLFGEKDDDGELVYDKLPAWVLEHNIILPDLLGMSERGYIKIPLPYLMNGIYNTGRSLHRGIRGGYTPGEAASSMFGTLAESLNPMGGANSFLNFVMPTVLDPVVDLSQNENFMGRPIAPPDSPFGADKVASQRYWNNTSPLAIPVADWISKISGGDGAYLPGALEVSPNQIEYVYDFLTGGAGTFLWRAYDVALPQSAGGKGILYGETEISANDIPFARRVYGNVTTQNDLESYIKNRDRVMQVRAELRDAAQNGDTEHYKSIIENYPDEYKLAVRVNKIENARKKLSAKINKIRRSTKIDEAEKKKLIDQLKQRQNELVGQANKMFN